jgi:hypothetical protein
MRFDCDIGVIDRVLRIPNRPGRKLGQHLLEPMHDFQHAESTYSYLCCRCLESIKGRARKPCMRSKSGQLALRTVQFHAEIAGYTRLIDFSYSQRLEEAVIQDRRLVFCSRCRCDDNLISAYPVFVTSRYVR